MIEALGEGTLEIFKRILTQGTIWPTCAKAFKAAMSEWQVNCTVNAECALAD